MSRYLVTGATGFLGRHLVAQLVQRGHHVISLAIDDAPEFARLGVESRRGSVLDAASVQAAAAGCEGVFHLAGKVSRDKDDAALLHELHVRGTEITLRAAKAAGVKRVAYASTSGVVAVSDDPDHIATEDDEAPLGIISKWPYYRSKLFAEQRAFELAKELSLEVVALNPSILFGPGDIGRSSTGDIEKILEGKVPAAPPGGLSFVDARDVAEAFQLAMDKGKPGRRYLLGACNMTLRAFVARVARLGGVSAPMVSMPQSRWLGKALVGLAELASKHLNDSDLLDPVSLDISRYYWYLDATRAETELGWRARDPLETLADTVEDIMPYVQAPKMPKAAPKRPDVAKLLSSFTAPPGSAE